MVIATSMKELTQDIMSSSEDRAEKLTELKRETRALRQEAAGMLKDFSTSRREASRHLRRQLAQSNIESRDEAQNLIKGFQASRKENGAQLRKGLAQGRKNLVQNEKKRKQQVGNLLEDFQSSRQETSAQLRKDLVRGKAKLKSDVRDTLADAEALIKDYQSSRQTMGTRLKNDLGKDREGRKAEVEGIRGDFRRVQAELRADLNKASDAWRGMASAIRTKSAGGKTLPEAKTQTPAGIAPDLREKLLSIVNQHGGGLTLSEVAETLGLATVVLGKAAKALLEQGKVRKKGKLYFPVSK